jgi:hypothetical protein
MIEKIAALYKQGKLNGDQFRSAVKRVALLQMEKKALLGSKTIKKWITEAVEAGIGSSKKSMEDILRPVAEGKFAPTRNAVKATLGEISRAMSADDVSKALGRIDFTLNAPAFAASRAGGKFMPNAEKIVRRSARNRAIALSKPATSFGESILRAKESLGVAPTMALGGAAAMAGIKGAVVLGDLLEKRHQNGVIRGIIAENDDLDPGKAIDNFRSLQRVAPDIAGDKAIASGFIKRMNEFDTLDLAPLEAVSKIQEGLTKKNKPREGYTHMDETIRSLAGSLSLGV